MAGGSDWADLDGHTPLSEREIKMVRLLIQEHERTAWARKKLGIIVPWLIAAVGLVWTLVEWFNKWFTLR